MKRLLLAICLALPACATTGIPASPSEIADKTVLDERYAKLAELGYKGARTAVELAVDLGKIKGAKATRYAHLDNIAFKAVGAVRAAYRAGNAASYEAALEHAQKAVSDLLSLASE